jgi:hypothetical protein
MSTGELLDRAFNLYKRHFLLFVGIAFPAPIVILLCAIFSSLADSLPALNSRFGSAAGAISLTIAIVLGTLGLLFGIGLTTAATIRAVSALHLSKPITIRQAYRELRGRYRPILNVFISVAIRVFGGSMILYLGFIALGVMVAGAASVIGTAGFVIAGFVMIAAVVGGILAALTLVVRYSMAVQACVVETLTAKQALTRSVFLAKGSRNRILTIYVLFSIISGTIWGCLAFLVDLASSLLAPSWVDTTFETLAVFVTFLLTVPLVTVAMSLAYYDERVRKEGFDLQVLIAGLEAPAAKTAAAP